MILLLISCVILLAIAAYLAAERRHLRERLVTANELLVTYRQELREWQNLTLPKHGYRPLDQKPAPKPKNENITPKVVHRGQLEKRHADGEPITVSNPVTVHGMKYSRVQEEVLAKAKDIIETNR